MTNIQVRQNLVPASKHSLKSPYSMVATSITIHETANDASAKNEIAYMVSNGSSTSFHVAIDDEGVVQGIPFNRNAFHAGDGSGANSGNRTSIAAEICYSKSGGTKYEKAKTNAVKYIAQLLKERNWGVDRLRQHYDWNKKNCPHRMRSEGKWEQFKKDVQKELDGTTASSNLPKLIVVKTGSLNIRKSPSWSTSAIHSAVKKGEAFTPVQKVMVEGTAMYKLKSGLYITGNTNYVELRK